MKRSLVGGLRQRKEEEKKILEQSSYHERASKEAAIFVHSFHFLLSLSLLFIFFFSISPKRFLFNFKVVFFGPLLEWRIFQATLYSSPPPSFCNIFLSFSSGVEVGCVIIGSTPSPLSFSSGDARLIDVIGIGIKSETDLAAIAGCAT